MLAEEYSWQPKTLYIFQGNFTFAGAVCACEWDFSEEFGINHFSNFLTFPCPLGKQPIHISIHCFHRDTEKRKKNVKKHEDSDDG